MPSASHTDRSRPSETAANAGLDPIGTRPLFYCLIFFACTCCSQGALGVGASGGRLVSASRAHALHRCQSVIVKSFGRRRRTKVSEERTRGPVEVAMEFKE